MGDVLAIAETAWNEGVLSDAGRRFDWNADGFISLGDVLMIAPVFNNRCLPVVGPQ